MNSEAELFVRMKYEVITADPLTWVLCNSYPTEVLVKWAWRCAESVEYLAAGDKILLTFIDECRTTGNDRFYRMKHNDISFSFYFAYDSMNSKTSAAYAATYAADAMTQNVSNNKHIYSTYLSYFNLYIAWLIEELYEYECRTIA